MNQPYLSRVPLAAYASELTASKSLNSKSIKSHLRAICGAALGAEISRDIDLFQNRGLFEIDRLTLEERIDKYRRFEPDHCAHEIGAWLRGEYAFDPHCLTE